MTKKVYNVLDVLINPKVAARLQSDVSTMKKHPIYGEIPTNRYMALWLILNKGAHIPKEKIKCIAEKFGYRYKVLQENYDALCETERIFEEEKL